MTAGNMREGWTWVWGKHDRWKKDNKDGRTKFVPQERGVAGKLVDAVEEAGVAVVDAAETALNWKKKKRKKKQRNVNEQVLRRAKQDRSVADLATKDEEFLPGGEQNVLLRLEYMTPKEITRIVTLVYIAFAASIGPSIYFHVLNSKRGEEMFTTLAFEYANLAIASVLIIGLILTMMFQLRRRRASGLQNKSWSRNQIKLFWIGLLAQILSLIILAAYIVRAIDSIIIKCTGPSVVSASVVFVNWLVISTFMFIFNDLAFQHILRKDKDRIVKKPDFFIRRVPGFLLFITVLGILIAMFVVGIFELDGDAGISWREICQFVRAGEPVDCGTGGKMLALETALGVVTALYFALFLLYVMLAWRRLQLASWLEHRWKNITLRLLFLHTFMVYIVLFVVIALNIWADKGGCRRVISMFSGFLGDAIIMTAWSFTFGYMGSPRLDNEGSDGFRQCVLMKFLWTECDIGSEIFWCQDPASKDVKVEYGPDQTLDGQPVFVFETMVKLLWYSSLIYLDEEVPEDEFDSTLRTAMDLYNLNEHKIFHEPELQVRAIVAWSDQDIVVAFRGTQERSNIVADIMLWRTGHPNMPNKGKNIISRWWKKPLVHYGFLLSFLSNHVGDDVVRLVYSLVVARSGRVNVRFTGHSLGGALATLCAYEVARGCHELLASDQIMCYTFGAPRVGNKYLAKELERAVPNLWNVVNNVDMIYFTGKLFGLYKHPGLRVMLDSKGDILVRPSDLEVSLRHFFFTERVSDHFLDSYLDSTLKVCDQYAESRQALGKLVSDCPNVRRALQTMGGPLKRSKASRWEENDLPIPQPAADFETPSEYPV